VASRLGTIATRAVVTGASTVVGGTQQQKAKLLA